jgi:endonuclease/exonuclease/phosphatase family metal-dependent hydrolase
MVANWAPSKPLSKGVVREFKTITFKMGVVGALDALTSEEDVLEIPLQKYAKSNELKIMSFNVRTKTDGDTDIKNWEYRKDACVALIKDQMPTIIGFQEADYTNQWKYLKDQLTKEYDGYGVNRDTGKESGSGETMGILYNKNVVQKLDGGTFWLSETPDTPSKGFGANYARNATWGLFKHIPTGITFYYINTHLDHQVAEAQIEEMKLISQHFEDYKDTYPLFLTGDMNIRSDNVALDVIEDYMYNTRDNAPQLFTDYNTTYNGYATNQSSIIDHIYCSDYLRVEEYHTINEDYGVPFVSDHYPIYAIVKLE